MIFITRHNLKKNNSEGEKRQLMFWESLDPCLEGNDVTHYGTEEIFVSTDAAIFSDLRHPKTEGQDAEEWAVRRLVSVLPNSIVDVTETQGELQSPAQASAGGDAASALYLPPELKTWGVCIFQSPGTSYDSSSLMFTFMQPTVKMRQQTKAKPGYNEQSQNHRICGPLHRHTSLLY